MANILPQLKVSVLTLELENIVHGFCHLKKQSFKSYSLLAIHHVSLVLALLKALSLSE